MNNKFLIFVILMALLISMIDTKKAAEVKKAVKPKVVEPEDKDANDNESAHVDVVDLDDTNFDREMTQDDWLINVYLNEFSFFDELQDWAHKNEIYIRVGRIDSNETDLVSTLNLNNTAPYWVYVKNWTTNYILEGEPTLRELQHFLKKDYVNHQVPLIYEMYTNDDEDDDDKKDDEEIKKLEQEEKKKKNNKKEEKKNNKKEDKKNNNNKKDDKKKKDEVKKTNDSKNNKKVDNKKKDTPPKVVKREYKEKDNTKKNNNNKRQDDDDEEEEQQNNRNNKKAPKKVANKKQKDEDEDEEEEQQNNKNNKQKNNKPAKQVEPNEEEENQNEEQEENQGEDNQNENDESGFPEDPDTIVLNGNNFERKTASGTWFVDFYAPWCPHCKELAQVWAKLATRVKKEMGRRVHIAKLDVDKHEAISNKYKVEYLPSIILFKDGKMYNYGEGEHTEKALLKFLNGGYLEADSTDSSNEFVGREPDESDNEQNSDDGKKNNAKKNAKKNGARRNAASSEPEEPSQFEKICGKKCQRFLRSPLFITSLLGVLIAIFVYLLFFYTPSDDQSFVKKSRRKKKN